MKEKEYKITDMDEILNNKTFKYRLNGFMYACRMDDVIVKKDSNVISKQDENGLSKYFIACNKYESDLGTSVAISGHYEDLSFVFINYFKNNENLDKRILDLPFSITLEKKVDDETYKFDIMADTGNKTKFIISKYSEFKDRTLRDDVCFYANNMDFSKILKLVKGFVYNPRLGFNTYNWLMSEYHVVFTSDMVDKMVMKDDRLDKPVDGIKKKIKSIFNRG